MDKIQLKEMIWNLLERRGVARFPPPIRGRIPNFEGAGNAAQRLEELSPWKAARVIKANPDSPQRSVRRLALLHGKTAYMAVPRLRDERCFLELDPAGLKGRGGLQHQRRIPVREGGIPR
jgi:5-formyltetrahydrofolate cyclo-ligase